MHHFWSIIDFFQTEIYRPNLMLVIIMNQLKSVTRLTRVLMTFIFISVST